MLRKLLIANRGEIAIRIVRAAAELGIATVGVHSEDDATSLHVRRADEALALKGTGAAAYLDIAGVIAAARKAGCDASIRATASWPRTPPSPRPAPRPGSRSSGRRPSCSNCSATRRGARPGREVQGAGAAGHRRRDRPRGRRGVLQEHAKARHRAEGRRRRRRARHAAGHVARRRSPTPSRAPRPRPSRPSATARSTPSGWSAGRATSRCRSSATARAASSALGERECTLQRRRQKIVEMAPSPTSSRRCARDRRRRDAHGQGREVPQPRHLRVPGRRGSDFFFIEANPRLQVEHTVTEEVLGRRPGAGAAPLAGGATLAELGLPKAPRRAAMRCSAASTWRP